MVGVVVRFERWEREKRKKKKKSSSLALFSSPRLSPQKTHSRSSRSTSLTGSSPASRVTVSTVSAIVGGRDDFFFDRTGGRIGLMLQSSQTNLFSRLGDEQSALSKPCALRGASSNEAQEVKEKSAA